LGEACPYRFVLVSMSYEKTMSKKKRSSRNEPSQVDEEAVTSPPQGEFDFDTAGKESSYVVEAAGSPAVAVAASEADAVHTALVYLLPEQADLVRRIAEAANLRILAAGAPGSGGSAIVADSLSTERCIDFRHQILELNPDLVWVLTLDEVGDEELALLQRGSGRPVLTLEPLPAGISDCPSPNDASNSVVLSPLLRHTQMVGVFNDIRDSFGVVRSINVTMRGHRIHGSLYARLTDAVDIMEYLCGSAEQVDAAMSGPLGEPPDSLRAMHGHITVNARFTENCCACMHVSDLGASWARGLTILGEGGCIRLTDRVFEWWNQDGNLVDTSALHEHSESRSSGNSTNGTSDQFAEGFLLDAVRSTLDLSRNRAIPPSNVARTVAVCEAVRLSLRTGQAESPRKILQLIEAST